ncbi:hypothetical protein ACFWPV_30330 [Streptomyces uncialis]|uniref:hypothetical protein n=1 Tax=Streptomyces uncialis TaxID=1048205 RepID=UPI00365913D9
MVLTEPADPTADLVITELNDRRVPVVRLDPGTDAVTFSAYVPIIAEGFKDICFPGNRCR